MTRSPSPSTAAAADLSSHSAAAPTQLHAGPAVQEPQLIHCGGVPARRDTAERIRLEDDDLIDANFDGLLMRCPGASLALMFMPVVAVRFPRELQPLQEAFCRIHGLLRSSGGFQCA